MWLMKFTNLLRRWKVSLVENSIGVLLYVYKRCRHMYVCRSKPYFSQMCRKLSITVQISLYLYPPFVSFVLEHFESPEFERKRRLQDWFVSGAAFYLVGGSLFGVAMFLIFNKQSWYFLFPLPFDMKVEVSRKIWPLVIFTLIELWYEITQWVSFIVITYINALFLLNVGACLGLLL